MIKNWKQFILLESNDIKDKFKNFEDYMDKNPYSHPFGLKPDEIVDLFYSLDKEKFFINSKYYRYIDDSRSIEPNSIRTNIKIDEELTPCLDIVIKGRPNPSNKSIDGVIDEIKRVLKKIIYINKYKSGYNFNKILIIDPFTLDGVSDDIDGFNPFKYSIKGENPFDSISNEGTSFIYKEGEDTISSNEIRIILVSDKKVEVTPTIFYDFYDLTDVDKIDKKGNLWCVFRFKDIADILFESDYVERFFEPEEWDEVYTSYDYDYTISDVINDISDENKKKLINFLYKEHGLEDINSELEDEIEPIESLEDFLDIDDDDLTKVFQKTDYDILRDILNRYDGVMSDKYYKEAEEYIKDETTDFLDSEYDISYQVFYNEKEYYDELWICFNPEIFVDYYSDDGEPEDWEGQWGDVLYNSSVYDIIKDFMYDNSNNISWNTRLGYGIYLDSDDINNYIQDIFSEYGIK